jgi:hypothetical protein
MELSLLFYGLSILTVRKNTLYELESLVDTPACQVAVVERKIFGAGGFITEPFNVTQLRNYSSNYNRHVELYVVVKG